MYQFDEPGRPRCPTRILLHQFGSPVVASPDNVETVTDRQSDAWPVPPEDRDEQDIPVTEEGVAEVDAGPVRRGEAAEADVVEQSIEVPDDEDRDRE